MALSLKLCLYQHCDGIVLIDLAIDSCVIINNLYIKTNSGLLLAKLIV